MPEKKENQRYDEEKLNCCDQKDEQPDVNEIRKRSYSFNNKIFQENAVDRFFHNENKEQTIEDFIKFDL